MRPVALALCLAAAPAAAQDLVFDIGATLSCLEAAGSRGARLDCLGRAAEACMRDTPGGDSTVGMGGCLRREHDYWDARLNDSYQALMVQQRARDADDAGYGPANRAESLRAMQRAWIPLRDATCDFERAQWGGGTGGGPATAACLMRETAEQTLYLERMAREY